MRGKNYPAFIAPPEAFTLVTDPKHPLFDERVNLPVDEAMVNSIMCYGVAEPVVVRRNGPLLEVADGRQRVKNAIEANIRLKKQGREPVRVMFVIRRGEDKDILGASITLNEIRRPDEILIKAAKAARMMNHGLSLEECGVSFGVNAKTVENWLRLLDLHPTIRTAVQRGQVKYTVAMRLAVLSREKQIAKYEKLKKSKLSNANAVRVVVGGKLERVCPPSKQQLRRVADAFLAEKKFLTDDQTSDCYSFAAWVLGRISTDELFDVLSSSAAGSIAQAVRKGMGL